MQTAQKAIEITEQFMTQGNKEKKYLIIFSKDNRYMLEDAGNLCISQNTMHSFSPKENAVNNKSTQLCPKRNK